MPRPLTECRELIVATTNANKLRELNTLLIPLGIPVLALPEDKDLSPIVEDGLTLGENARKKAVGYAKQLGQWILADDTGLEVDALRGAPGVRSARYAGEEATQAENLALLTELMRNVPDNDRGARFVCRLCVADFNGEVVLEAMGECRGRIGRQPIGQFGFGYDAMFVVAGMELSLAQLDADKTAIVGHRGSAARALIEAWHRQT